MAMSDTHSDKKIPKKYTQLSDSQLSWVHIMYQWLNVQILTTYFVLVHQLKVYGKENCPKKWQPFVVAANHISNLDPPLISVVLAFRPISYMAKIELFDTPFMRFYNWMVSAFAVNREKLELSTIKTAQKVLRNGKWALGIFPEGTRSKDGSVQEAKKGVAYFAKSAKVPIVPIGIYHRGKKIRACVGKPIPTDQHDLDELSVILRDAIAALVEEASQKG
jgi:1-acyl-sn-glycerol-3-phosphate acyltransferase